jgi:hypothetical protein
MFQPDAIPRGAGLLWRNPKRAGVQALLLKTGWAPFQTESSYTIIRRSAVEGYRGLSFGEFWNTRNGSRRKAGSQSPFLAALSLWSSGSDGSYEDEDEDAGEEHSSSQSLMCAVVPRDEGARLGPKVAAPSFPGGSMSASRLGREPARCNPGATLARSEVDDTLGVSARAIDG